LLRSTRPDVIHFEWNSAAIDHLASPIVWTYPVIISCRGTQVRVRPHVTPGYAQQLRQTFDRARAVHCVCETIRNEAMELGLPADKAVVIYPAVDCTEFIPSSEARRVGPLCLLSVGALIWTKGVEYALLTMRRLLDEGISAHLEMIGAGRERERVLVAVRDMRLEGAVSLVGAATAPEVRAAMQRCDVFLHSSLSEGVSNAALEAMACGIPVVTSDAGGMHEAVRDGLDGFVVPVRDPSGAAAAVARLARDHDLRTNLGRNGRGRIVQRFRLEDHIAGFIELYERVASAQTGT